MRSYPNRNYVASKYTSAHINKHIMLYRYRRKWKLTSEGMIIWLPSSMHESQGSRINYSHFYYYISRDYAYLFIDWLIIYQNLSKSIKISYLEEEWWGLCTRFAQFSHSLIHHWYRLSICFHRTSFVSPLWHLSLYARTPIDPLLLRVRLVRFQRIPSLC